MPAAVNIRNQRFSRLLVLERAPNIGRYTAWECLCTCGNKVVVRTNGLRTGNTTSCGCWKLEATSLAHKMKNPEQTFWKRVKRGRANQCWPWKGKVNSSGYGSFQGRGAHVYCWEIAHGPTEKYVLHTCDNRRCCNLKHLFAGTQSDNIKDQHTKGRNYFQKFPERRPRGEKHKNAKLTSQQANRIRRLYATKKYRQADLGVLYGVSQRVISLVTRGESYK